MQWQRYSAEDVQIVIERSLAGVKRYVIALM